MKKLIITEKPSVAEDFSKVLNCKKMKGYYEGSQYVISYNLGHLFEALEPHEYDEKYKVWNLDDLPIIPKVFKNKPIERTKSQFYLLKELINRADVGEIIDGGDRAPEGFGIAWESYLASGTKKPFKAIWYEDLTEKSIKNAFNNVKDANEYIQYYYAYLLRSRIDWTYGLGISRCLTLKLAKGQKLVLSYGRCQIPILRLIVDRDLEIENFIPKIFYKVIADFKEYKGEYVNLDNGDNRLFDKEKAIEIAQMIKDKKGIVTKLEKEIKKIQAPSLFTLTDLKVTLSNKYGFNQDKVLEIAQKLYIDKKILTYPRSGSNYVSEEIAKDFKEYVSLLNFGDFESIVSCISDAAIKSTQKNKKYVDNSKIEDHHSIIPTLNENMAQIYETLSKDEKLVFNEVALRFLAIFYKPYEYESLELITKVGEDTFITKGNRELSKGWKAIYSDGEEEQAQDEETSLIDDNIKENTPVIVQDAEIKEGTTKKPKHYTTASILKTMKKYNIGTEATRGEITAKLFKRGYVKEDGKHLISTKLGRDLIRIIPIEEIKSIEMTANLEEKLNNVIRKKVDYKVLYKEALEELQRIIEAIKNIDSTIAIKREIEPLGVCPQCDRGYVVHKKGFYGCTRYKDGCTFTLSEVIKGGKIKESDVSKLLENGKTNLIKGSEKSFKILLKDKKISIEYGRTRI